MAAFRRALALRHNEAYELDDRGVRFRYLYIDSNGTDIHAATNEADAGKWAIPGKSVHLEKGDCLSIDGSGFTMEQARMQANIAPWYGDTIGVDENLGQGVEWASQRRRFGRMLLARRAGELKSRLLVGKDKLTRGSKLPNSITYHIFATLGGGTGSGCIVDLVTSLYATAVNVDPENPPEIYLYLYVAGGGVPRATVSDDKFFLNEYSALRDLNALMAGRYKPNMATYEEGTQSFPYSSSPIKSVFISSEQSDRHLSLSDQVDNMANACLDLISLHNSDGITANNIIHFSSEDRSDVYPGEITSNDTWNSSQQRQPAPEELCERSYRFQTISVSRCKEPVREIETILKCALAQEVIIRLLEGNESRKICTYEDNPGIYQLNEQIAGGDLEQSHHEYREKILGKFEEKYKPEEIAFEPDTLKQLTHDTIKMVKAIQEDTILDSHESSDANIAMQKRCQAEAAKLKASIEAKLKDKRDWSKPIMHDHVEIWGVEDIITYLTHLTTKLSEEINKELTFSQTYGNLENRHSEWNKICGLTHLTKKQNEMYELHYQEALAIIKRAYKEREAMIRRLVWKALKSELLDLISKMKKVRDNLLQQKAKQEEIEMKTKKLINFFDNSENISYIYDDKALNKHRSYYRSWESHSTLAQYMIELDRMLHTEGERPLNLCIPDVDALDDDVNPSPLTFWNKSRAIHMTICQDNSKYKPAYHSNIYEALSELKTTDTKKYHKILESLHLNLAPSACLDPSPMGGNGLTINYIPSPYKAIQFGRPSSYNNVEIAKEIEVYVSNSVSYMANDSSHYATFDLNDKHELRVLYTIYWMPVRFFSFMRFLHNAYHCDNLDESRRKTNLYYSNIDDKDDQKPDLVPRNASPRAQQCRLYYTIGALLPVSGENMLAYKTEVSDGVKYHVYSLEGMMLTSPKQYDEYTANQMAEGSDALYQHLQNAVHAWFALETADPAAVLAAMMEKHEDLQNNPDKKDSHECELLYAAYNEFKKLVFHFSTR